MSQRHVSRETRFVRRLFSDTKVAKYHVQNVLDVDPAGQSLQGPRRQSQLLGDKLLRPRLSSAAEAPDHHSKNFAMPLSSHHGSLAGRKEITRELGDGSDELIHPRAL
jgi:hypothetical protein